MELFLPHYSFQHEIPDPVERYGVLETALRNRDHAIFDSDVSELFFTRRKMLREVFDSINGLVAQEIHRPKPELPEIDDIRREMQRQKRAIGSREAILSEPQMEAAIMLLAGEKYPFAEIVRGFESGSVVSKPFLRIVTPVSEKSGFIEEVRQSTIDEMIDSIRSMLISKDFHIEWNSIWNQEWDVDSLSTLFSERIDFIFSHLLLKPSGYRIMYFVSMKD